MSELESSGLLDKDSEQTATQNTASAPTQDPNPSTSTLTDTHMPSGSTSQSPEVDSDAQEATEANLAATIVNAVTDGQAEAKRGDTPEQHTADAADDVAASSEAAEQRVLGDLEGAPTWREVLALLMLMLACIRQGRDMAIESDNSITEKLECMYSSFPLLMQAYCLWCFPVSSGMCWACSPGLSRHFPAQILNSSLYECSTLFIGRHCLSKCASCVSSPE